MEKTDKSQKFKSNCSHCLVQTNHFALHIETVKPPPEIDYIAEERYLMIQCSGCETISFRHEFHDFENAFQIFDGTWDYHKEIKSYPNFIEGYRGLLQLSEIPKNIRKIYKESLEAIKNENFILAGVGLRMVIEAITIEEKIKGKDLKQKISELNKSGLISKKDADRLHAIRFLGNDAAHEIKEYKKDQIILAFEILEHLLKALYGFESEIESKLEMPINTYKDFKSLVIKKCNQLMFLYENNSFTLTSLLGTDRRRLINEMEDFEEKITQEIINGTFSLLILDDNNPILDIKKRKFKFPATKLN